MLDIFVYVVPAFLGVGAVIILIDYIERKNNFKKEDLLII